MYVCVANRKRKQTNKKISIYLEEEKKRRKYKKKRISHCMDEREN